MERIKEHPFNTTVKVRSMQEAVWVPDRKNNHKGYGNSSKLPESASLKSSPRTLACRNSQYRFWQAHACLRRANRDLGEAAAFVAASLTTVTAIQAVISIANDKLELSRDILHVAFDGYIMILALIFVWGASRANNAIRRRAQAERELDQAKKKIFDFCPIDKWPKVEE